MTLNFTSFRQKHDLFISTTDDLLSHVCVLEVLILAQPIGPAPSLGRPRPSLGRLCSLQRVASMVLQLRLLHTLLSSSVFIRASIDTN